MRVDKDDRYVTEAPKNSPEPISKLDILDGLSKSKLVIAALTLVIILLLLSLVIFRTSHKNGVTPLMPISTDEVQITDNKTDKRINTTSTPTNSVSNNINNGREENSSANNVNSVMTSNSGDSTNLVNSPSSAVSDSQLPLETSTPQTQSIENSNSSNITNGESSNTTSPISVAAPKNTVKSYSNNHKTSTHQAVNDQIGLKIADNHYVIQISASSSAKKLKEFAVKNQIADYHIYQTKRNNKPWFILVKGNYASSREAKEAIKSLPAVLQKNSPWVKSGSAINKEKAVK
ncbi:SPOR domain-containing protein [Orbaceae bacterium ESL0721]|nr:SPOR domain-containing protein [Orbaceae bacterium ESL0721]